jgi:FADH2 O2-dependent halogenase
MKPAGKIAIVGSGFAGSIMALILRRLEWEVVLIEKSRGPRFAIGESSTPLANLMMEQIAAEYDLPFLKDLSSWGSWQKNYPEIACGLKRGFTFCCHTESSLPAEEALSSLLVAASPADAIADTHWYRSELDAFLARKAVEHGAELFENCELRKVTRQTQRWELLVTQEGREFSLHADFILDASGTRGALARAFAIPEQKLELLEQRWSIYSHFRNVARFPFSPEQTAAAGYEGNDAALHHLFPGGWIWVLRFNNGLASAGAVLSESWKDRLHGCSEAEKWRELLAHFPAIQEQFKGSDAVQPFRSIPNVSYRAAHASGQGWALLPSAAGLVDPLLSTGFPLTLLGILRLARFFHRGVLPSPEDLREYEQKLYQELDAAETVVAALFRALGNMPSFAALSLLYFAAASFGETAQRLRLRASPLDFLLCGDPVFGPGMARICRHFLSGGYDAQPERVRADILRLIEPIDVAGLARPNDTGCHGIRFEDLYSAAPKLGVGKQAIDEFLKSMQAEIAALEAQARM